jgi:ribose transport system ATP-binding protein
VQTSNILEAVKVSKSYPGVQALKAIDFDLKFGEVQALVGQNGAGKSTFIEIIAGSLRPDSGQIILEGLSYPYLEPSRSIELGIQTVHQENQLVNELTVAENIYLYNLPQTWCGFVNYSDCFDATEGLLEELGIEIRPGRKIKELTFIEKKLVSIAKAFSRKAKLLILDEPTASLDEHGKNILFAIIRENTKKGLSVIYISHNLGEIFEICDRVTVLKDGKKIATHKLKDIDMNAVVQEMIGRSTTSLYIREKSAAQKEEQGILEVCDYSREGVVDHVSFTVRKGVIFGLDRKDTGRVVYRGRDITPQNPYDAIQKGIGYLTEDRKENGLMLVRPVFENISLARFAKSLRMIMNLARERSDTTHMSKQLNIKTPSINQIVINLSGGNQQKVVLAKWLYAESEVIIFDEPTVGIDVGAKGEIYRMMENLARQGKIIIMISSDNPELIAVCDRVSVMRDGRLVAILKGKEINEENILRYSMGVDEEE